MHIQLVAEYNMYRQAHCMPSKGVLGKVRNREIKRMWRVAPCKLRQRMRLHDIEVMVWIIVREYVIPLNLIVKPVFSNPAWWVQPHLLMRFIIQLSSYQPFILFYSSHSYDTFGQVLWHELANPVPQADKFSLYAPSFHGNLISSTLTALSSSLAGFFFFSCRCSSSHRISLSLSAFLWKHILSFSSIIIPLRNCQLLSSSRWSIKREQICKYGVHHSAPLPCCKIAHRVWQIYDFFLLLAWYNGELQLTRLKTVIVFLCSPLCIS